LEQQSTLRCLSLPLQDTTLVVPGSVVSEVVPYVSHTPVKLDADWILGRFLWRGLALPLVSFEVAAELVDRPSIGRRVAIFNTVGGNPALPFYAVFIQAVPRLLQIGDRSLDDQKKTAKSSLLRNQLDLEGKQAYIPDLDKLEALILAAWSQAYEQQQD